MTIKQISVFVENEPGRLADVTSILADNGIDLSAVSISDTTDFGILRMIVNQPEKTEEILRGAGFTVSVTEVLVISVENRPGGLAGALKVLADDGIGVEYMYAIGKETEKALIVLRVEDTEAAVELLEEAGFGVLPSDAVYEL
ncbi:MAG: ACT domain-containing protein [Bacillota bacterium]